MDRVVSRFCTHCVGDEWLDAFLPPSPLNPRQSPCTLLYITTSVGYRRQTASVVHHVVNVRRFLSCLIPLDLPTLFFSRCSISLSSLPVSSLINAFIRLAWTLLFHFPRAVISFPFFYIFRFLVTSSIWFNRWQRLSKLSKKSEANGNCLLQ